MSLPIFTSGTTNEDAPFTSPLSSRLPENWEAAIDLRPGAQPQHSIPNIMPTSLRSSNQHLLPSSARSLYALTRQSFVYLNPAQQARDILAVADALGFGTQSSTSSPSGAALSPSSSPPRPERVAHLIAHEMPSLPSPRFTNPQLPLRCTCGILG